MAFEGIKGFLKRFRKKSSATFPAFSQNAGIPQRPPFDQRRATFESYMQNNVAYACITMVAEQAAHLPFEVFVNDKKQDNHPLLTLLNNPNPGEAKDFFFEKVYSYWQIDGSSYIEAAYSDRSPDFNPGEPVWLYSLRPNRVSITPGKNFIPAFYEFDKNGKKVRFNVTVLGKSNLLQLKKFHPLNDYFGMSSLMPAAWAIDQHNNASQWNLNLLRDAAQPTGNLIVEGALTLEQRNVLHQELDEKFSGPNASRRPMILEDGVTWKENSMTPRDMDFLKMKKSSAADIALAFGVPLVLLNTEQAKFENLQASNEQLWSNTVLPLVNNVVMELNMWLSPRYGPNVRIAVDLSRVPVLMQRRSRELEALEKITFLTINEKRKRVGQDPIEGGDDLLVELNKVPLSALSSPFPPIAKDKKSLSDHLNKKCGYNEIQTEKIIKLLNQ